MADTLFFKVISHTNDGEQQVQYVAWREKKAVVFSLGDPATDPYTASDPNAPTDDGAGRPATVRFVLDAKSPDEKVLSAALSGAFNVDHVDPVDRPPISRVDLGAYTAYGAWFGSTLEM